MGTGIDDDSRSRSPDLEGMSLVAIFLGTNLPVPRSDAIDKKVTFFIGTDGAAIFELNDTARAIGKGAWVCVL